ncbi:hypothetical protein CBS101457_001907 [Exobasidium rhododendri]|nr:hypothetical protein CBS101457_001907 [Exobasidium rhododendri]
MIETVLRFLRSWEEYVKEEITKALQNDGIERITTDKHALNASLAERVGTRDGRTGMVDNNVVASFEETLSMDVDEIIIFQQNSVLSMRRALQARKKEAEAASLGQERSETRRADQAASALQY